MGYWKLVDAADGWDTHKDKYEWVEEVEEKDRYGYKTGGMIFNPPSTKYIIAGIILMQ